VALLSDGNTEAGLKQLDELGWVREIAGGDREQQLAADYLHATAERKKNGEHKTALVIAPTHAEGERITQAIRDALKCEGKIIAGEQTLLRLERTDLTEAERGEAVNLRRRATWCSSSGCERFPARRAGHRGRGRRGRRAGADGRRRGQGAAARPGRTLPALPDRQAGPGRRRPGAGDF